MENTWEGARTLQVHFAYANQHGLICFWVLPTISYYTLFNTQCKSSSASTTSAFALVHNKTNKTHETQTSNMLSMLRINVLFPLLIWSLRTEITVARWFTSGLTVLSLHGMPGFGSGRGWKMLEAFPMSNRANPWWLKDGCAAGQGWANQKWWQYLRDNVFQKNNF